MTSIFSAVALAISLLGVQPDLDGPPHAKPRLIAETTIARPGATTWIGITFDIDPHWHIYWDGDGDTGQPVVADFLLPPGCKVGEIVWPTPKRYVLADTILDYTYEERVTLLVPMEVPATAKSGENLKITANLKWMECSEECLPRKAKVVLDLPIGKAGEEPTKSTDAPRFEESRRRVPVGVSETAKVVQTAWHGDTMSLKVPGAARLIFFPHRTSAKLTDALKQGEAKKDELTIDIDRNSKSKVLGILQVVREEPKPGNTGGRSEFYWIEQPVSGAGK